MVDKVIYYEPQFKCWHDKIDCSALLGRREVQIRLLKEPPEGSRPCAICATLGRSCD